MATFTEQYHSTSYAAISPDNAANSQVGRCVLVTGGSEGIGFAIATAFRTAEAAHVIIMGRREDAIRAAAERLESLPTTSDARETTVTAIVCDIASKTSVESAWQQISEQGLTVDVLVLNAALATDASLADDLTACWNAFETNVLGNLRMAKSFLAQTGTGRGPKNLLNISSFMVHSSPAPTQGAYSASKTAFASVLQHLADEIPVDKAQLISIHPGAILTESARRVGYNESSLPWDDASLPGSFCVWASTRAASFLHGKFVWANWDVDELVRRKAEIADTPGMLRIGLQGSEFVDIRTIFGLIGQKRET